MRKKLITKLVALLLIISTFSIIIANNDVKAVNTSNTVKTKDYFNLDLDPDEKIMEYDAMTGETREVDMEEVRERIEVSECKRNSKSRYSVEPIKPATTIEEFTVNSEDTPVTIADSMERITNTSVAPYIKTCRVVAKNSKGNEVYSTAAIIGKKLALTAAHSIFNPDDNFAKYSNWTLYPGYNGNKYYGGSSGWSKVYYSNKYKETRKTDYDWAICVLNEDIGSKVGTFGIRAPYTNGNDMLGLNVTAIGFPADLNYGFSSKGIYMYRSMGSISAVYSNSFRSSIWIVKGQSGSPIINSDRYIVGIASSANSVNSYSVRISQSMVDIVLDNL